MTGSSGNRSIITQRPNGNATPPSYRTAHSVLRDVHEREAHFVVGSLAPHRRRALRRRVVGAADPQHVAAAGDLGLALVEVALLPVEVPPRHVGQALRLPVVIDLRAQV